MTLTIPPGGVVPDLPHLGHLLPLGTDVSAYQRGGDIVYNEAPQSWVYRGSNALIDTYLYSQPAYLRTDSEVSIDFTETAEQFRWRLRDSALGAAERSGVNINATKKMCAEFGAPAPLLYPGGTVQSATDWRTLPIGSVVYRGHPDIPQRLGVWEVVDSPTSDQHALKSVMGPLTGMNGGQPLTIHSIPGWTEPESTNDPVSPTNWASIALRAWRVGKVYKSSQGWCGVFENMLTTLGITEESVKGADATAHGPGDVVTATQAATMPEGTLLWHEWRGGYGFALYVRDDSKRNRGRTRRVCGWQDGDGENTWDLMTVVQTPTEPMLWTLSGMFVRHLPRGSVVNRTGFNASRVIGENDEGIIDHRTYSVRSVVL